MLDDIDHLVDHNLLDQLATHMVPNESTAADNNSDPGRTSTRLRLQGKVRMTLAGNITSMHMGLAEGKMEISGDDFELVIDGTTMQIVGGGDGTHAGAPLNLPADISDVFGGDEEGSTAGLGPLGGDMGPGMLGDGLGVGAGLHDGFTAQEYEDLENLLEK